MSELQSILRLQTWLSPAFPTGAFAYSSGLETAAHMGLVSDQEQLTDWLIDVTTSGQGWNDAVLLAESWRLIEAGSDVSEVTELAEALSFSKERHLETMRQGEAFLKAAKAWNAGTNLLASCPLPVAVGAVAASLQVPLDKTLAAYLHAYVSNQIQAALRLIKLGQQGGVEVLVALESVIIETAEKACKSGLDQLGSSGFLADVVSMKHEMQESRIFKS